MYLMWGPPPQVTGPLFPLGLLDPQPRVEVMSLLISCITSSTGGTFIHHILHHLFNGWHQSSFISCITSSTGGTHHPSYPASPPQQVAPSSIISCITSSIGGTHHPSYPASPPQQVAPSSIISCITLSTGEQLINLKHKVNEAEDMSESSVTHA
ncbi:hypothetical protein CHS0354_020214 [Potamilus streckersoni]|uniref:Uncharacterized protein n=1 Tax=Potamilus streckersoni TaxID=2493646 RepID=A0AAE0SKK6_9BIVA|nr:hypothetical protein CHS0354_020214 [Potamilus streckersoni]